MLPGVWLWLACGVAQAESQAQVQGQEPIAGIYTCVDARGRKLTSDRPIPECLDREQRVLNPSGTVRAQVGPNLTAQERADLEAREKERSELRAQQAEEKRRDRALLTRYPRREAHDRERASALAQVALVSQTAEKRIDDLRSERRKLDQQMEFYTKDPTKVPPALRRQIEENDSAIQAQKRFIAEQENERNRVIARFDEEFERLKPLWAAQGAARVDTKRAP